MKLWNSIILQTHVQYYQQLWPAVVQQYENDMSIKLYLNVYVFSSTSLEILTSITGYYMLLIQFDGMSYHNDPRGYQESQ